MSVIQHSKLAGIDNHALYSFPYNTEAERLAAVGFIEEDIGKLAWQKNDNSFYVLTSYSPAEWTKLNLEVIDLDDTISDSTGIIYKGGLAFIHNFHHPTGDTAVPDGTNLCIGEDAGNFTMGSTATQTYHGSYNTFIGYTSGKNNTIGSYNTANGTSALFSNTTGNYNTANGVSSLYSNTEGYQNTANGVNALYSNTIGYQNTANGRSSLRNNTTGNYNTANGYRSLYDVTDEVNCTGIGYNAQVTASYQVQLGDSNTTTYVYGTVQNRSDERDKAEIKDTALGLDFINRLRPVDFKWDFREDYYEEVKSVDENGIETITRKEIPKDGSKVRNRNHSGFIAQEVKLLLDDKGVDFGGYQDHSISGGKDVLSLGYDEFIAPLVKAVQELTSEVQELKDKIRVLETA
jgi:hypothetical protein